MGNQIFLFLDITSNYQFNERVDGLFFFFFLKRNQLTALINIVVIRNRRPKFCCEFRKEHDQRAISRVSNKNRTLKINCMFRKLLSIQYSIQTLWMLLSLKKNGKDYSGAKFSYTEPIYLNKAHSTK